MVKKQCSKCNADFECTSTDAGCWCQQYDINEHVLADLRKSYADCLCPNCLKNYDEKSLSANHIAGNEE